MTKRPYTKNRRAELEAETRERIVHAAVALHAEHGGLGTSYAMIAQRAQVSPQTVYNHFPGQDTLFGACTGHVLAKAPPLGPESFRSGRTPADRLRLLAKAVYARHDYLAPWMRKSFYEAALSPELGAIVDRGNTALRELIAAAPAPERVPAAGFVEAAFVLLDFPAWKEFSHRRSSSDAARLAGECLARLLPALTRPAPRKEKP
ncbi:MAG TPA: TetR/AcrR family transcriptional regulator [Casimicrobiaceae bacterium]|nr:TetR/AcrR family transcriptional regulator [Casimicrobiaceae bacterium]